MGGGGMPSGMPPMGGGGMPPGMGGGMMGQPPPFGGGPPPGALSALDAMAQQPQGIGEKQALRDATSKLQVALSRVLMRSPHAAKLIADAISRTQQAASILEDDATETIGPPPDLLGAMTPSPMGSPPAGPGAGFGV